MTRHGQPDRGGRGWSLRRRILLLLVPGLVCIAIAVVGALLLADRL